MKTTRVRAKDLKPGDEFIHRSRLKIPSIMVADKVVVNKRTVTVTPKGWENYKFSFQHDQWV